MHLIRLQHTCADLTPQHVQLSDTLHQFLDIADKLSATNPSKFDTGLAFVLLTQYCTLAGFELEHIIAFALKHKDATIA